ncbi:Cof-type HAD-IIB family hydrolase [uncultured Anaerococcus sp.]|uniref:Cof-type HAD-IIB family hydrolase n=1 Tax=uncultured Anaerococcus sp. TaxID=293428 RepID=UPI00280C0EC7|nr:Cof-type HAD-IIB family hydrolase [uncultured Anaerococcus sp.]MDU5150170.1 Cof-type HAD-IIB family hydrolase [Anaerococcus prevotii]
MIKLITIDVDGTLVTPLKRLTKENISAIEKAKKAGIHIALVSGRPFHSMVDLNKRLGLDKKGHFTICQNGSYVFDNFSQKPMFGTFQSPSDLIKVAKLLENYRLDISAMDGENFYSNKKRANIYTKIDAKIHNMPIKLVDYENLPEDMEFGRFMVLGSKGEIKRFIENMPEEIKNNYYPVQTAPFLVEIMNKNTNKGYAISQMADKLGYKMEEVMAIGNEKNDIPMLEAAGFAVAMGNAVDELKKHADYITKSNLKSGVGYAINRLLKNNKEKFS